MGKITMEMLEKLFLSGYPLNKWSWPDVFDLLLDDRGQKQYVILNRTLHHPLTFKYPLKLSYQRAFLKKVINKLEDCKVEVIDEFYEAYTKLLGEDETGRHYRHFQLNSIFMSIKESPSLVSEGTTGLHVWQASMALAEWCLKNKEIYLKSRNILELGSGIGFTGLACILGSSDVSEEVSKDCSVQMKKTDVYCLNHELLPPRCFTFSDCHPAVIQLLCQNVERNLFGNDDDVEYRDPNMLGKERSKRVIFNADHFGTEVRIIMLPWEDVSDGCKEALATIGDVDLILAADVVYDESLFKPLVGTLRRLLSETNSKGNIPSAILACTMRNTETVEAFVDQLRASGLKVEIQHAVQPQYFLYEDDPPVCIYSVRYERI